MQIARHWRLNPVRYRLQGVRYENGTMSLHARPTPAGDKSVTGGRLGSQGKVQPDERTLRSRPGRRS